MAVVGATKVVCGVSVLLLLALKSTAADATTATVRLPGVPAAAPVVDAAINKVARWGFRHDRHRNSPSHDANCAAASGATPCDPHRLCVTVRVRRDGSTVGRCIHTRRVGKVADLRSCDDLGGPWWWWWGDRRRGGRFCRTQEGKVMTFRAARSNQPGSRRRATPTPTPTSARAVPVSPMSTTAPSATSPTSSATPAPRHVGHGHGSTAAEATSTPPPPQRWRDHNDRRLFRRDGLPRRQDRSGRDRRGNHGGDSGGD